jgi:hypothetical protein
MTPPAEKAAKAVSIAGISWSYFRTLAIAASDRVSAVGASRSLKRGHSKGKRKSAADAGSKMGPVRFQRCGPSLKRTDRGRPEAGGRLSKR